MMPKRESNEVPYFGKTVVNFDTVLGYIGSFGRYQVVLVLMVYYMCLSVGMHEIAVVFLAAIPPYRCFIPGVDDNQLYNDTPIEYILNATTPYVNEEYDTCSWCNFNYSKYDEDLLGCRNTNKKCILQKCTEYVYDHSVYENTVTTEWNLVCDRLMLGTTVNSVFYVGVLFSSIFGGNIADLRIGRVPTMIISQMSVMVVGIGCAFSPTLTAFAATRCVVALFLTASFISAFVYVMEITSGKWRTVVGINIQAAFAVGYMILSGLAYKWKNWRELQIAMSLVSLPFAVIWIFIPESPRWLFSKGINKKAKRISYTMAKKNGVVLPENIWEIASTKEIHEHGHSYSSIVLFRRPLIRLLTINIMFVWFVISLVYYGLSLNVGNLSGDDYINNTFSGLAEVLSCPIVILTIDRFGRRLVLSIALFFGGLSCLGSTVANHFADDYNAADLATLATVLAMCGKLAASGAFATVYNYTAELYPTVIRSTAVGIGSMAAVVASVLTPYTLILQYTVPWLSGTVFGVLALAAGGTSLLLPETMGIKMMTTIDEAEEFYANPACRKEPESNSSS